MKVRLTRLHRISRTVDRHGFYCTIIGIEMDRSKAIRRAPASDVSETPRLTGAGVLLHVELDWPHHFDARNLRVICGTAAIRTLKKKAADALGRPGFRS